jgi:hypothetical protein
VQVVFWQSVLAAILFTPFGIWLWQEPSASQLGVALRPRHLRAHGGRLDFRGRGDRGGREHGDRAQGIEMRPARAAIA